MEQIGEIKMFIVIVIIISVIGCLAISSVMLSSRISREEERNEKFLR